MLLMQLLPGALQKSHETAIEGSKPSYPLPCGQKLVQTRIQTTSVLKSSPPSIPDMSSQTVFRLTLGTGLEGLRAFKETIPIPSKDEILIKIHSVALNYRDVAIATSSYPLPVKDNVILCSDMAGEVIQIGDHVTGFTISDRVIAPINVSFLYGQCRDHSQTFGGQTDGMLREYIALPAHAIIKLPKSGHDFEDWAAVIGTGSTVWNAFYGNTPLKPGDTVLVLGKSLRIREIKA
jgi:NADPH:quinone reductase-like Zn-dependent oxidoreductase